jgi:hypothetical protein
MGDVGNIDSRKVKVLQLKKHGLEGLRFGKNEKGMTRFESVGRTVPGSPQASKRQRGSMKMRPNPSFSWLWG